MTETFSGRRSEGFGLLAPEKEKRGEGKFWGKTSPESPLHLTSTIGIQLAGLVLNCSVVVVTHCLNEPSAHFVHELTVDVLLIDGATHARRFAMGNQGSGALENLEASGAPAGVSYLEITSRPKVKG